MHRRQLVHRDVKPTNIALSYQNRDQWYLIDYGDAISVGKKTPYAFLNVFDSTMTKEARFKAGSYAEVVEI